MKIYLDFRVLGLYICKVESLIYVPKRHFNLISSHRQGSSFLSIGVQHPCLCGLDSFDMKVLIACEESQTVCKAFRYLGHEAYSNDLKPCSGGHPEWHIQESCFHVLCKPISINSLQFLGFHPECTFLTNSGVRWLASTIPRNGYEWSEKYQIYINSERWEQMEDAALFFKSALANVRRIGKGYVENPIMHKYAMEIIGEKPTQIIQPWQFGHLETKATCLWIVGLRKLVQTNNVYNEMMKLDYKDRAKIHNYPPSLDRAKFRSKTYSGIATAMATQWGSITPPL